MTVTTPPHVPEPDELQALIEEARQRTRRRRRRNAMLVAITVLVLVAMYLVVGQPTSREHQSAVHDGRAQAAPVTTRLCDRSLSGLSALAFPTAAAGWVLAGSITIDVLGTTDGGSSWRCELSAALVPTQLVATDARHAWVLGGRGTTCGEVPCTSVILGTLDGRHWSVLSQSRKLVTQLAFASAQVGLAAARAPGCSEPSGLPPRACAGQILRTSDGGRHWRAVLRTPDPIVAVAGAHNTFWAVETRLGVGVKAGGNPGLSVLVSHDHGVSWTEQARISLESAGLRQHVQLLPAPDGRLWLTVFDQDVCAMHGCGGDDVWLGTSSGRTWRIVDPYDRSNGACGVAGPINLALDKMGGAWATVGRPLATCEAPATTLFTLRSSAPSWTVTHQWPGFSPLALALPSASTGYALGLNGLTKTTNGGRNWRQVLPLPSPGTRLDTVTSTTAYAAQDATDQGAVLETSSGGRRWRLAASLPVNLADVDFVARDSGFALGVVWNAASNAPVWRLYATKAGAHSWALRATLPLHGDEQVSGLWMASGGRGLMLVSRGFIFPQVDAGGVGPLSLWKTTDAGKMWTQTRRLAFPSPDVLTAASFVAAGRGQWDGWLRTSAGIQATTSTGRQWHPLAHPPNMIAIQRVTPDVGVGWDWTNGVLRLWHTTDAGGRWTRLRFPSLATANAPEVSFSSQRNGWVVANGSTWRTTDGGLHWTVG